MAGECCQLVGNLNLGIPGCIISVSTSCNTEVLTTCGETPLEGASTSSVNFSAYASTDLWVGCPAKAGVSIPYVRKYDCVNDTTYFIFSGQGQSFMSGDVDSFISLKTVLETSCTSWSASSSSGPSTIYMETTQYNGYGLAYTGGPISFDTSDLEATYNLGILGTGFYLQSFNYDAQSGQLPIVSYSFVKSL